MSAAPSSIGTPTTVPSNMSFLFHIQEIQVDFSVQQPRFQKGQWYPPDIANAIKPRPVQGPPKPIYRWVGGTVTRVNDGTYPQLSQGPNDPYHFRTATVFTQSPNQPKFLAVNFDARRQHVRSSNIGDWQSIDFHYTHRGQGQFYSFLDCAGEYTRLVARGASSWIQQLFPTQYHWTPNDALYQNAQNAGLTGQLPLILAVAAFSCPPQNVEFVLRNCMRPGRWALHSAPHGRKSQTKPLYDLFEICSSCI